MLIKERELLVKTFNLLFSTLGVIMSLKKNVCLLTALVILASCNDSDNNSPSVSNSEASSTTASASNPFSKTLLSVKKDINDFKTLAINDTAENSTGLTWWNEASQWKLRDPRLVCTQEDVSICDKSEISTKTFLNIEMTDSKLNTFRNYETSLGVICSLGEMVDASQKDGNFIKQGKYSFTIDAAKSAQIQKTCGIAIPQNAVVEIDASEDVKDVALYDKKLTSTVTLEGKAVSETTLAFRDNEKKTYIATTTQDFLTNQSVKTVIWNDKDITFYRAESYNVPSSFVGSPAQNETVELTRLYKNGNGLAIVFDTQDADHAEHGREVVSYALKGNLIYPEIGTELNIVLNNYKQMTDSAMACFDKQAGSLTYCDVSRSIQFWNSLEQVRGIYGNFDTETLKSSEYTTLQFVNDDEVVASPMSL